MTKKSVSFTVSVYSINRHSKGINFIPFEGLEAGGQLVELCFLLALHSIMEELTNSVHLFIAEVTIGTEIEGYGGEFNMDTATSAS